MKGTMTVIDTTGNITTTILNAPPSFHWVRDLLGGPIELVPLFTTFHGEACVAFCNEEGKHDNLPVNHMATGLWLAALDGLDPHDILVGTVVIFSGDRDFLKAL